MLGGHETLEVVGESHYQDDLWRLVGGPTRGRVRCSARALLVPEPENQHDRNAVMVVVEGCIVAYLSREDAVTYGPGLQSLIVRHGTAIGLGGQIVGGGAREGRLGMLGVFLDHDPQDFGLSCEQVSYIGELRTGWTEAVATDLADDSYDLSWYDGLSGRSTSADVVLLRRLLNHERDPIDRHFMLAELGKCLYRARDAFASALDEFDEVCAQHDAEIDVIRCALVDKFGVVPVIEMYRQAAIRCQKAHDWSRMRFWAQRGLAVYGAEAARPEAVDDLRKRLAYADAKLANPRPGLRAAASTRGPRVTTTEVLVCIECGDDFERVRTRGRKPHRCPTCRGERAPTPA